MLTEILLIVKWMWPFQNESTWRFCNTLYATLLYCSKLIIHKKLKKKKTQNTCRVNVWLVSVRYLKCIMRKSVEYFDTMYNPVATATSIYTTRAFLNKHASSNPFKISDAILASPTFPVFLKKKNANSK